jgi:anti-repressor protein
MVYSYNDFPITFEKGEGVMVNATQMAKVFGKVTKDWLRTNPSKEFISSLSAVRHICPTDLVKKVQGGTPDQQGTWMHEDVAMEFARWLSPKFAIWCNDRIKELLQHGSTSVFNTPKTFAEALRLAADQQERIEEQQKQIEEQAPKVLFADAIEGSKSSCLIGELAKIISQNGYKIGQNRLFQWMRDNNYLGKSGERYNIPNQTYIEQGLFTIKKGVRSGNDGVLYTTITTKVTGKGQSYFINRFLNAQI